MAEAISRVSGRRRGEGGELVELVAHRLGALGAGRRADGLTRHRAAELGGPGLVSRSARPCWNRTEPCGPKWRRGQHVDDRAVTARAMIGAISPTRMNGALTLTRRPIDVLVARAGSAEREDASLLTRMSMCRRRVVAGGRGPRARRPARSDEVGPARRADGRPALPGSVRPLTSTSRRARLGRRGRRCPGRPVTARWLQQVVSSRERLSFLSNRCGFATCWQKVGCPSIV